MAAAPAPPAAAARSKQQAARSKKQEAAATAAAAAASSSRKQQQYQQAARGKQLQAATSPSVNVWPSTTSSSATTTESQPTRTRQTAKTAKNARAMPALARTKTLVQVTKHARAKGTHTNAESNGKRAGNCGSHTDAGPLGCRPALGGESRGSSLPPAHGAVMSVPDVMSQPPRCPRLIFSRKGVDLYWRIGKDCSSLFRIGKGCIIGAQSYNHTIIRGWWVRSCSQLHRSLFCIGGKVGRIIGTSRRGLDRWRTIVRGWVGPSSIVCPATTSSSAGRTDER